MTSDLDRAPRELGVHRTVGVFVVMVAVPALYLVFVIHFWMNALYADEWSVVPLVNAALHGHLTLSALWAQHNENRMLFPNLAFVSLGVLTHDDQRALILLSAAIFIATFWMYLLLVRSYLSRPLTPLVVLVIGVLWFSIEDWENALFGYQLAWYLILFFLIGMLYLLLVRHGGTVAFGIAVAAAILASISSVQGLILWPVGIVCLVWTLPADVRRWGRRNATGALVWLGSAIATTVVYFWGYTSSPTGFGFGGTLLFNWASVSPSFALHHPIRTAEFVLVEIGEVLPNTSAKTVWLNGMLGAVLLAISVSIISQSVRRRHEPLSCLPVALIIFGFLFDVSIAVGRVVEGVAVGASQSRYTMANLVILVAIVTYSWSWFRLTPSLRIRILSAVGIALVAVQTVFATTSGISDAKTTDRDLSIGSRLVVNLNRVPAREDDCYSLYGVFIYLYPTPGVFRYKGFTEAQEDQLSVFSPVLLKTYRAEGLPPIPECEKK